jgi:hypothetical protein
MRRAVVPLVIGCVLVAIVALVVAIVGWSWEWFAAGNGAVSLLLLVLTRGAISGEDERRPPGPARVSAARWAGPMDPDTLAEQERGLYPDPDAEAAARAEDVSTGFSFLWSAVPPALAGVIAFFVFL